MVVVVVDVDVDVVVEGGNWGLVAYSIMEGGREGCADEATAWVSEWAGRGGLTCAVGCGLCTPLV